eukprot:gene28159-34003_t
MAQVHSVSSLSSDEDSYVSDLVEEISFGNKSKRITYPSEVTSEGESSRSDAKKKDLRPSFPKLFENGMNSSDPVALREVLEGMFAEDIVNESYRLDKHHNLGTEKIEYAIVSKESVVQYFLNFIITIPDSVFLIHEWKLFPRGPDASCLVFKFSFTGSQMYEYESSCLAQDNVSGYVKEPKNAKHSRKRAAAASVTFKESSRNSKYEARKRNRQYTIGEYVDSNRVTEEYKAQTAANVEEGAVEEKEGEEEEGSSDGEEADEADGLGEDGTHSPSKESADATSLVTATTVSAVSEVTPATMKKQGVRKINMIGVMRFHINAQHLVYKIHCVHIHGDH